MNKDNKIQIQLRPSNDGENVVFSFEVPANSLQAAHVEAFLKFVKENQASHVMKSLLHIYFTARDDQFFDMSSDQMLCFEHILTLLADLSCEKPK